QDEQEAGERRTPQVVAERPGGSQHLPRDDGSREQGRSSNGDNRQGGLITTGMKVLGDPMGRGPAPGHDRFRRDGSDQRQGCADPCPDTTSETGLFVSPEVASRIRVYQIAVRLSKTAREGASRRRRLLWRGLRGGSSRRASLSVGVSPR